LLPAAAGTPGIYCQVVVQEDHHAHVMGECDDRNLFSAFMDSWSSIKKVGILMSLAISKDMGFLLGTTAQSFQHSTPGIPGCSSPNQHLPLHETLMVRIGYSAALRLVCSVSELLLGLKQGQCVTWRLTISQAITSCMCIAIADPSDKTFFLNSSLSTLEEEGPSVTFVKFDLLSLASLPDHGLMINVLPSRVGF
jgi:hypothetical protein